MSEYGTINDRRTSISDDLGILPDINSDESKLIPCVRYGSSSNSEPTQFPTLRPVYAHVPEGATTASPIYYVTEDQLELQEDLDSPYAVQGDHPIAKSLQDECEAADRVRYPVVVESDSKVDLDEMALEVVRFVKDYLEANPGQYTVWYSGGKSIHVHVAAFVDKSNWDQIKREAEAFNESEASDIELDTAIYSRKRQFRLPGVEHRERGGLKIQIEPEWSHEQIFRKAHTRQRDVPETFLNALSKTVPPHIGQPLNADPLNLQHRIVDTEADDEATEETSSTPPIHQRERPPSNPGRWLDYHRHNDDPVSPYANAEADDLHSVIVVRVMGEPFGRGGTHYVPCDVLGAVGGDGQYRVFGEDRKPVARPVKLSGHDIKKWDYEQPEYVVILGGKSRRSRIFSIANSKAVMASLLLEDKGRRTTLRHFDYWGYDTGSTGMNGPNRKTSSEGSADPSEAAELQRQIEHQGVDAVDNDHKAMFRIACRLLRISGWDSTWNWIKQVYGDEFNPHETYDRLSEIVDHYPDYDDITVPPQPPHE